MKTFLAIVSVVMMVGIANGMPAPEETKYTTKYDNVNLDDILNSDRLLKNYVKCLMDEGPCTSDGQELKKTMPDAIATDCSKCSERQKEGSDKVISFLIDKKPEMWTRLEGKYDAEGVYKARYLKRKEENKAASGTKPVTE